MFRAVAIAVLVSLPVAAAAPVLTLVSDEPVTLSGDVAVVGGTSLTFATGDGTGEVKMDGAMGRLQIVTWTNHVVRGPGVVFTRPNDDVQVEELDLRGATISVRYAAESLALDARADQAGSFVASGAVRASGVPSHLVQDLREENLDAAPPTPLGQSKPAPSVAWACSAGDAYLGQAVGGGPGGGFPFGDSARIAGTGDLAIEVDGGNATIADASGTRDVRLGRWRDAGAGELPAGDERRARLVFEGAVESLSFTASHQWLLCGAAFRWNLTGDAAWREATGEYRDGSHVVPFADADVVASGALDVAPAEASLGSTRYRASGTFSTLRIGADAVESPPAVPPAAAGASLLAIIVVAVGFLPKLVVLYTRIARGEVLEHETRRRIHDAVVATPGLPKRELQRIAGCAWGPFTFHLRVLREAGYVRLVRETRYVLVHPSAVDPRGGGAPVLPNPLTRALYAALPADGSPRRASELARELGISRELLNYHLRKLVDKAAVDVTATADGGREVRRGVRAAPSSPGDVPA